MNPFFPIHLAHRENTTGPGLRQTRRAMLACLLVLGAAVYFVSISSPGEKGTMDLWPLRWVGYGLCLLVIVVVARLRRVRQRAPEAARPRLSKIGSLSAEVAVMFGGVIIMLGGEPWIYAVGLLILLGTWRLLPADPQAL
jgi:hypothetical protein